MAAVGEAAVTASELPVSATVTKYFNIIDPVWQKYPVTDKGEYHRYSNLALTRVYHLPWALQYAVKIKDNAVIHRGPRCGASKRMVNKLHSNVTLGFGQNNCSYWGQLPIGP